MVERFRAGEGDRGRFSESANTRRINDGLYQQKLMLFLGLLSCQPESAYLTYATAPSQSEDARLLDLPEAVDLGDESVGQPLKFGRLAVDVV